MTHTISPGHNSARLAGSRDWLDTGAGNAKIAVYSAPRPSPGAAPGAAVKLCEYTLDKPCGVLAAGVLTLSPLAASVLVANSGTATWARISNGNGDWSDDVTASAVGDGGEVELSSTVLYAGGTVILGAATLS